SRQYQTCHYLTKYLMQQSLVEVWWVVLLCLNSADKAILVSYWRELRTLCQKPVQETGFDAPLHSLEQHCIKTSQKTVFDIINKFNIPYRKCGATLVAWTEEENKKLPDLRQQSLEADIHDVNLMSLTDLHKSEPYLRKEAVGALNIPGECVIDSYLLGLSYAHQARMLGSKICTSCEVSEMSQGTLITSLGPIYCKVTINCAGLYGDIVDQLAGIDTFRIYPRKGQYCVFGKNASPLLNSIIFPVPTEKSKGIALFNSVYNNVMMGPTAQDSSELSRPASDPKVHWMLTQKAQWLIPDLATFLPVGHYVGVRPATQFKDYQIRTYPHKRWITVGGIRSTGVSGSLGIAQYVCERLQSDIGLEPERGATNHLLDMAWSFGEDKTSVTLNGYHYPILHPMVLYGQDSMTSKL
ncbi:FAD/NAD(p)-binding oxidoreductase, partial [Biomphalaria glabrata]